MHLVEILLPVCDDNGEPFPVEHFEDLANTLTAAFGGVTSFIRSPAEGRWHDGSKTEHDDIAVIEVMVREVDRCWWKDLKLKLAKQFKQDEVVVRCHPVELL